MSYNAQFLPLEIQTSVKELRALGTPESALALLIDRILKASEAKTTSLQMSIVQIEESITLRLDRLGDKLQSDIQTQLGNTNAMLVDVRNAQMNAHPQIMELRKAVQDLDIWSGRLEQAFIAGRDFAADERARLEVLIVDTRARVTIIESILEITPPAAPAGPATAPTLRAAAAETAAAATETLRAAEATEAAIDAEASADART